MANGRSEDVGNIVGGIARLAAGAFGNPRKADGTLANAGTASKIAPTISDRFRGALSATGTGEQIQKVNTNRALQDQFQAGANLNDVRAATGVAALQGAQNQNRRQNRQIPGDVFIESLGTGPEATKVLRQIAAPFMNDQTDSIAERDAIRLGERFQKDPILKQRFFQAKLKDAKNASSRAKNSFDKEIKRVANTMSTPEKPVTPEFVQKNLDTIIAQTGDQKLAEARQSTLEAQQNTASVIQGINASNQKAIEGRGTTQPTAASQNEAEIQRVMQSFGVNRTEAQGIIAGQKETAKRSVLPSGGSGFEATKTAEELSRATFGKAFGLLNQSEQDQVLQKKYRVEPERLKAGMSLRKEFNNLPEIKSFKETRQRFSLMEDTFKRSQTADLDSLVALDQALITSFNKITDPGSVVRESEYLRTAQNLSFVNKLRGKYEKLLRGGGGLTDVERQELVSTAGLMRDSYFKFARESALSYAEIAEKSGIDPELVITIPNILEKQAGGGNEFDQLPNPAEFKGKLISDTNTGERYKSDGNSWRLIK